MKFWSSFRKYARILHRNIGYLLVGVTLIYGVSGYLLNHIGGHGGTDPAYTTVEESIFLPKDLSKTELKATLKDHDKFSEVKRIMQIDEEHYRVFLDGGIGVYRISTGVLDYELHKRKPIIYYINKIHYNKINGWSLPADIFAFGLIFLALSGPLMVKGKNSLKGNGKWWLIVGLVIPVIYIFLM